MSATLAARAHSHSTLTAPVKRPAPSRKKVSWLLRVWRIVGRRPGRAFVLLTFSAVAAAILANALIFQKARHPAPILSAPLQTPHARSVERRAEPAAAPTTGSASQPAAVAPQQVGAPPARPSDLTQLIRETAIKDTPARPPAPVAHVSRPAPAPVAAPAPAPVARSAPARDPIADLINGDLRPPAEIRGAKR